MKIWITVFTLTCLLIAGQSTEAKSESDARELRHVLITTLHSEIKEALKDHYQLKDPHARVQFKCVRINDVKELEIPSNEAMKPGYEYEVTLRLKASIGRRSDRLTMVFSNQDNGEQFKLKEMKNQIIPSEAFKAECS